MGSSNSLPSNLQYPKGYIGRGYAIQAPHELHKCIGFIGLPRTGKTSLISILSGRTLKKDLELDSIPCTSINNGSFIRMYEIVYPELGTKEKSIEEKVEIFKEFFIAYGLNHLKFLFIVIHEFNESDILIIKVAQENGVHTAIISTKFDNFTLKINGKHDENFVQDQIFYETRQIQEKLKHYAPIFDPNFFESPEFRNFFISLNGLSEALGRTKDDENKKCEIIANELSLIEFFKNKLVIDLNSLGMDNSQSDLDPKKKKSHQYGTFVGNRYPSKNNLNLEEKESENFGIKKSSHELASLSVEDLSNDFPNSGTSPNTKLAISTTQNCTKRTRSVSEKDSFITISKQVY